MTYTHQHNELFKECQQGKSKAQYEIYQLYAKGMFNVSFRMLKNHHDAEDVLQSSFVDVFTKIHQFKYDSSPGAWIKRIVINNCINHLRKKRVQLEEISDNVFDKTDDLNEDHNDLNIQEVHNAIMSLPDGFRVVLSLYLIEGYDHGEISTILNISESTSKSQYSRAKKKLREILHHKNFERYDA